MQALLGTNRTVVALFLNAVILLLILLAITTHDGKLLSGSAAFGQAGTMPAAWIPPTAGKDVQVMPCQLAQNTWGCYVMDKDNQTLSVYQFSPSDHNLKLAAARDIQYDRQLGFFNTSPAPLDVKAMLDRASEPNRAAPTTNQSPESNGGHQ